MDWQDIIKGFVFDKSHGQNFVFDANLLRAIVADSGIESQDRVVEIGTGAGSLTVLLSNVSRQVLSYEIDKRLQSIHARVFDSVTNVQIEYADFMSVPDQSIVKWGKYRVVANLPYYITTPIIFKLLESSNPPISTTIMVQQEVAQRIVAQPSTKDYGALSVNVQLYTRPSITRQVNRKVFVPEPSVDSAVVRMDAIDRGIDNTAVARVVKAAFGMRRKTLINNLSASFNIPKSLLEYTLQDIGIGEKVRGEDLSVEQFVLLTDSLGIKGRQR